jgi:hypothetical protein
MRESGDIDHHVPLGAVIAGDDFIALNLPSGTVLTSLWFPRHRNNERSTRYGRGGMSVEIDGRSDAFEVEKDGWGGRGAAKWLLLWPVIAGILRTRVSDEIPGLGSKQHLFLNPIRLSPNLEMLSSCHDNQRLSPLIVLGRPVPTFDNHPKEMGILRPSPQR